MEFGTAVPALNEVGLLGDLPSANAFIAVGVGKDSTEGFATTRLLLVGKLGTAKVGAGASGDCPSAAIVAVVLRPGTKVVALGCGILRC